MTQHPNGDAYTIAATDGRGGIAVLAQVEHHDLTTAPSPDIARAGNRTPNLDALRVQDVVLDVAYHFDGGESDGLEYAVDASGDSLQVTVTRQSDGATRTYMFSPNGR